MLTYNDAKALRRTIRNPWLTLDIDRAFQYSERGTARSEFILTVLAYVGCAEPIPCECGKTAHYRATVGCVICPSCRAMYSGGSLLRAGVA